MSTIFFYWDVKQDKEKEYFDFIWNDYLPSMGRLGITLNDGWVRIAGEGPQIMALGESDDYQAAVQALQSRDFRSIEARLLSFVENYSHRFAKRNSRSRDNR